MPRRSNVLLIELQADDVDDGKLFDGFTHGEFVDMRGRNIIVEADEIEPYFTNTKSAIEATRSESGEIVGLPIDITDHDKGDAAGWIVGAELENVDDLEMIRFSARWTDIGRDVIENDLRRFFSATFDTQEQVILGGSLTNWPASRDEEGHVLLRPVELSERTGTSGTNFYTFELQDEPESMEDRLNRIRADFSEQFPNFDNRPFLWVEDTFDTENYVIVEEGADHFRVNFSENDDSDFEFADRTEWVEVKQAWIDAAREAMSEIFSKGTLRRAAAALRRKSPRTRKPRKPEGDKMKDKIILEDLSTEERNELALGLFAELAGSEHESADLGERFSALVDQRATSQVEKQTAIAAREKGIVDFSEDITGGTDEYPVGVPLTQDEIQAFLSMLTDEAALAEAKRIFGKIQSDGLVAYTENGHARRVEGAQELPEEYVAKLDSGEFTIADLKDPVLGLGDLAAYDLSAWKDQKVEA